MDERLDDLLALAAPPIPLMAGREALLGEIIAEAQLAAAARRLRRRRRWCLAACALLVAVGVGVGLATAAHQRAAAIDGSGGDALRILSPMVAGRMCEVSFTATSQPSRAAGERAPDAALTAARAFLHSVDPALISESVRDGFAAYDQAAAETGEHPASAAAFSTSTQQLQEWTREAVAGAGLRAADVRILPSVECASVPR